MAPASLFWRFAGPPARCRRYRVSSRAWRSLLKPFGKVRIYRPYEITLLSPSTPVPALLWPDRLLALSISTGRTPLLGLATDSERLGEAAQSREREGVLTCVESAYMG